MAQQADEETDPGCRGSVYHGPGKRCIQDQAQEALPTPSGPMTAGYY